MKRFNHQRVGLAVFASILSAVVFIRCSPIAPSVPKSSLYGHQKVAEKTMPAAPEAPKTAIPSLPENARIVKFETKLLGETSFYTLDLDPSHQKVMTLSAGLIPESFEELRKTGKTEIQVDSTIPKKITVVFRLSDDAFLNTEDTANFDSSLDPLENGKWVLRLSNKVPSALSEHVLRNLEAVTVIFDSPEVIQTPPTPNATRPELDTAVEPLVEIYGPEAPKSN